MSVGKGENVEHFMDEDCVPNIPYTYFMSKKKLPILYDNLIYKMDHYFLDIQYLTLIVLD